MPCEPRLPASARAKISCTRCHRRKKRCDKVIPVCGNCASVQHSCSLAEEDHDSATYSVAFVHSLEERVRELEEQQANLASNETHQHQGIQHVLDGLSSVDNATSEREDTTMEVLGPDAGLPFADQHMSDHIPNVDANMVPSSCTSTYRAADDTSHTRPRTEETLEQNLRNVSLAAVAEPYLGTISGLTFAKLTQAVLRRLSPDGRDFVFRANINENAMPIQGATNLHLDLINSMYFDYDQAIDFSLLAEENTMPLFDVSTQRETIQLPTRTEVLRLATFYFDHSHTLYPIIHQQEVMSDISSVLQNPDTQLTMSPPCLFRIWMVLAIGSTTHSSIALTEEFVSQLYYEKAMTYFDAAMDHCDVTALEAIMLQVSFSFFNQSGPNTWFLVGTAARLALGMGLHCDSTYQGLSNVQAIRRKRLFFSIYMMDRLVSITLGRPFAIHEDDIDISNFTIEACEELDHNSSAPYSALSQPPMTVTDHILRLRKIANDIATKVYCKRVVSRYTAVERQQTLEALHADLVQWRQSITFPLPNLHSRVPQGCTSWYDLNFYTHLTALYRPSPLFPTLDIDRINILTEAAAMAIRHANSMRLQKRLAFNWLTLLTIYNAVIALVYSVTVRPENLATSLECLRAIEDLELAAELFTVLAEKFPASRTIGAMVAQIIDRYRLLGTNSPA